MNAVLRLVTTVLSRPKLIIVVPSIVMFLLAYQVFYDMLVKKLNAVLASQVNDFSIHPFVDPDLYRPPEKVVVGDLDGLVMTKVTVLLPSRNVLTVPMLEQLHTFEAVFNDSVVVLPLSVWPINLPALHAHHVQLSASQQHKVERYLLKYINFDQLDSLQSLFLDGLLQHNHFIKEARNLHVYILHKPTTDIEGRLRSSPLKISWHTSLSGRSARDFYDFLRIGTGTHATVNFFRYILDVLVLGGFAALLFATYLAVANEHKIRLNIGLLIGWFVEILMVSAAGANIVVWYQGYESWRLLFEPFGSFVLMSYTLTLLVMSARGLFYTINELAGDNSFEAKNGIRRRLYRFYTGSASVNNRLWCTVPLPGFCVVLITNILGVTGAGAVAYWYFRMYFDDVSMEYLNHRLLRLYQATCISLVLDHMLQLTYLVGIVVIDLKRNELTDILNDSLPVGEVNIFSHYLLGLNDHASTRPPRTSVRYRVGQQLLKVRRFDGKFFWLVINPTVSLVQYFGMFSGWAALIPKDLVSGVFRPMATIAINYTDYVYYLEMFAVLLFIEAMVQLTFTLTKFEEKTVEVSDTELTDDARYFKTIDLQGHKLDVLRLYTNPLAPFVVSTGLDHNILVWLPLNRRSEPVNIATTTTDDKEVWPVNFIKISSDGTYIIVISFKHALIKCYHRDRLDYLWEKPIAPEILANYRDGKIKILESFFRKRTVPGYLTRKILHQRKQLQRRGSDASAMSYNSQINSNFPPPEEEEIRNLEMALSREEFIVVLEKGELVTIACDDGSCNETVISEHDLTAAKKISSSRVSDKIICTNTNNDIIVANVINNKWRISVLPVQGSYNTGSKLLTPQTLSHPPHDEDFRCKYQPEEKAPAKTYDSINKPALVPIEFVGMVLRVENLTAQLIDVQTGVIIKVFDIGHFKPSTIRVAHSEPTHCKFCGCASVKSFSIIYEDAYDKTVIMHTFQLKTKKSKNNICLRVERDPREIRCLGFDSVVETQYWYENVEAWELTDVNMIFGFRRRDEPAEEVEKPSALAATGLQSLRNRKKPIKTAPKSRSLGDVWEAFIITAVDGMLIPYQFPEGDAQPGLVANRINSIAKYGFKSVAVNFGNLIKILYLGNDKLIENELYYSGTNTTMGLVLGEGSTNQLLFINKRRRARDKGKVPPVMRAM